MGAQLDIADMGLACIGKDAEQETVGISITGADEVAASLYAVLEMPDLKETIDGWGVESVGIAAGSVRLSETSEIEALRSEFLHGALFVGWVPLVVPSGPEGLGHQGGA